MPTNYLPGLRVRPGVPMPADGDVLNGALFETPLRRIADEARYAAKAAAKNLRATTGSFGTVRAFAEGLEPVAASAPLTLFAASGGLFRSEDGASGWLKVRSGAYRGAAFSAALGLWVAVGQDLVTGTPTANAPTWTVRTVPVSTPLFGAAAGPADLVVVGDVAGDMATLLRSTDGVVWAQAEVPFSGALYAAVYAQGRWVAVGGTPDAPMAVTSEDGAEWALVEDMPGAGGPLVALAFNGETFVAIAKTGEVMTSEHGLGFVLTETLPAGALGASIAADPETGIVLATAGDPGLVALSYDGGATFPERIRVQGASATLGFAHGRFLSGGVDIVHAGLRR